MKHKIILGLIIISSFISFSCEKKIIDNIEGTNWEGKNDSGRYYYIFFIDECKLYLQLPSMESAKKYSYSYYSDGTGTIFSHKEKDFKIKNEKLFLENEVILFLK